MSLQDHHMKYYPVVPVVSLTYTEYDAWYWGISMFDANMGPPYIDDRDCNATKLKQKTTTTTKELKDKDDVSSLSTHTPTPNPLRKLVKKLTYFKDKDNKKLK
eukprot:GFYU01010404.1.p2 GENE.GFYU01010404.1~~GFYU01010404.1.p2  ORF type:complete len:103 (-),score=27.15 GFYU01010404.1:132-440(-)